MKKIITFAMASASPPKCPVMASARHTGPYSVARSAWQKSWQRTFMSVRVTVWTFLDRARANVTS